MKHYHDFRCQVKQIIADFKAVERVVADISVGIESYVAKTETMRIEFL